MVKQCWVPYSTPPRPAPQPNPNLLHLHIPYPTPTHPTLPYSCPAIHRLTMPYPTLPFRCICRSVQMFRYFCCPFRYLSRVWSFRSVPFRSVKHKAIGTDRMNAVKSVDSIPELSKLYNCRLNKCRIVTC